MIDKFINNEMSDEEIDLMMKSFLNKKEEEDYRKKLQAKLIKAKSTNYPKIIDLFRKNLYKILSAASIIIVIIFSGLYFTSTNTSSDTNYTSIERGFFSKTNKLDDIINQQRFSINSGTLEKTNHIWELFNAKKYQKVINAVDKSILSNDNLHNDVIWMAVISAVKRENLDKVKYYLNKVNEDSPYFNYSMKMQNIIEE